MYIYMYDKWVGSYERFLGLDFVKWKVVLRWGCSDDTINGADWTDDGPCFAKGRKGQQR